MNFDDAYELSGIGRGDPVERMYAEAFAPHKEVSEMDQHQSLVIDLMAAEIARLRGLLAHEQEQLRFMADDLIVERRRAQTLQDEIDRLYEEKDALRDQLGRFLVQEQEQQRQERLRADLAPWVGMDPVNLLPKVKGWTQTRKRKLVAECSEMLKAGSKIPAIKHAREQFTETTEVTDGSGTWRNVFGLKEAKDFVDCIQAQEV
jgi:hypothetical protein